MAAWQFMAWLSPRNMQVEATTYWPDAEQAKAVLTDIARILPQITKHYSATSRVWGDYESNDITVYFDADNVRHISFRVDLMEFRPLDSSSVRKT